MLKLSVGDLGFMGLGLFIVIVMFAMTAGREEKGDPVEERETYVKFLAQFENTLSPALVIATVIGGTALAAVIVALWAKLS